MYDFFVGIDVKAEGGNANFRLFLESVERGEIGRFSHEVFCLLARVCLGQEFPVEFLNRIGGSLFDKDMSVFLDVFSKEECFGIVEDYYDVFQDYYWNEKGRVERFVVYDFDDIIVRLVQYCFVDAACKLLMDQGVYLSWWQRLVVWMFDRDKSLP